MAGDLRDGGFATKESLSEWLLKNTATPAWSYWGSHRDELKKAQAGVEPFAAWLKLGEEGMIPVSSYRPETPIEVLVVGGGTNAFVTYGDFRYVASASVDKWK